MKLNFQGNNGEFKVTENCVRHEIDFKNSTHITVTSCHVKSGLHVFGVYELHTADVGYGEEYYIMDDNNVRHYGFTLECEFMLLK